VANNLLQSKCDRWQVTLAVAGPGIMLWPFAYDLPAPETLLAWIMNWMLLARHNYILHNHVHHPFTTSKTANRILGILLGFVTGMTAGNWKITHVHGHHTEHLAGRLRSRPRLVPRITDPRNVA
jgi:fatty acid desaturase